jgi:hypothetical protein
MFEGVLSWYRNFDFKSKPISKILSYLCWALAVIKKQMAIPCLFQKRKTMKK